MGNKQSKKGHIESESKVAKIQEEKDWLKIRSIQRLFK